MVTQCLHNPSLKLSAYSLQVTDTQVSSPPDCDCSRRNTGEPFDCSTSSSGSMVQDFIIALKTRERIRYGGRIFGSAALFHDAVELFKLRGKIYFRF